MVCDDFVQPNGLAFSPDETLLYIVETGGTHVAGLPFTMSVYQVSDGRRLSGGRLFAECTPGGFDGLRIDELGNIWTSGGKGVHCYRADGTWLGSIKVAGEHVTNVAFGGPDRRRLFITAERALYSVELAVRGTKTF